VTRGESPWSSDETPRLGVDILSIHYAGIAEKLGQPILAAALLTGSQIPEELGVRAGVWQFEMGPLAGTKFVGGYFSPTGQSLLEKVGDALVVGPVDPLLLGIGRPTFFGVEYNIFSQICTLARTQRSQAEGPSVRPGVSAFERVESFYSGVSVLRDGSLISPAQLLQFSNRQSF